MRDEAFYLSKLVADIKSPEQRLRNLRVALTLNSDFIQRRVSYDVAESVRRKIEEFDEDAEKRGISDPVAMAFTSTSPLSSNQSSEQSLRNLKVTLRKQ